MSYDEVMADTDDMQEKILEDMRKKRRISRKKWSTNRICDVCGNNVKKDSYSKHVRTCKLKAERGDTLKQGDVESYCCEQCGKEFSGKYASNRFIMHKKNHHLKEHVRISNIYVHKFKVISIIACQYIF